jgi:LysR family glycine cleavage system transcriptional activator
MDGSVPGALEAAEHGLGVALAMHPLIQGRKGFGQSLVSPFTLLSQRKESLYLVSRPQQALDTRIIAFRRWLHQAVRTACGK